MYDRLAYLLSLGSERVLNDPSLLIEMLRIYSKIYLNSKPCEICKKFHIKYFEELEKTGLKILKKMADRQFILKDNLVIKQAGEIYTKINMTDKVAIERLRQWPDMISQFEKYPENWKELVNGDNIEDLKEQAKAKGIRGYWNMSKETLIERLKDE